MAFDEFCTLYAAVERCAEASNVTPTDAVRGEAILREGFSQLSRSRVGNRPFGGYSCERPYSLLTG